MTLFVMICFAILLLLLHWMLKFVPVPRFQLVFIQKKFILTGISPLFPRMANAIFAVQSGYMSLQEGNSDLGQC
jgi:hypothetical protein